MHIIQNNPYRTLGLLVGATARERERQINRLKQFIEAEQEPQDDFSFPTLGHLNRTTNTVTEAASKLNLDNDKMDAALFWFYEGYPITDEPAFDAIKAGDLDQALNIWNKLTSNGEVSQRNASAYSNLGTLYLSGVLEGINTNEAHIEHGISLKLKFLESDFVKGFKAKATDETYKTTKKELQLLFLNQVYSEIKKTNIITTNELFDIVTKQKFFAKEDFLKGFVQKPIEEVERKIKETRKNQKSNPAKAGEFGNDLFRTTKTLLNLIIAILGKTDIKAVAISDRLANEILQCSITLFNHFHDTKTEVGEIALDLNKKAQTIALGGIIIERINESTPIVEKYIRARPIREKQSIVGDDLKYITEKIEQLQLADDTISNAIDFTNACKPSLDKMKLKLGANDNLFLTINTAVIDNAQGMIISIINEAMRKRNNYIDYVNYQNSPSRRYSSQRPRSSILSGGIGALLSNGPPPAPEYSLEKIKKVISRAWTATIVLGKYDMSSKQKEHYTKNKKTLKGLYKNIDKSVVFFNNTPIKKWTLWFGGIIVFILLVAAIWGEVGLIVIFAIAFSFGVGALLELFRNLTR